MGEAQAVDWERIATVLIGHVGRCDKGQCVHPYIWSVRNEVGTTSYVCDECKACYDDPSPVEREDADSIRIAWLASGLECSYCVRSGGG